MAVFKPGQWYLTVVCPGCATRLVFQECSDQENYTVMLPSVLLLTCSACKCERAFHPSAVIRTLPKPIQLPQKPMEAKAGNTSPGLVCRNCSLGICLGGDLNRLPVVFEAICDRCKVAATYKMAEIKTLVAYRLQ
jgi:hypothetical protein